MTIDRPLAGRSIVVCRARHQAEPLIDGLEAQGARVVALPLIEVVAPADPAPLADAVGRIETFDWVAFTSVNAVDAVARGLAGSPWPSGVAVAVVGVATQRAAEAQHWPVSFVAEPATAAALAAGLATHAPAGPVPDARVLAPLAELAGPDLVDGLAAAGFDVERVDAYRTEVPVLDPAIVADAQRADAVLLLSGSMAQRWHDHVAPTGETAPAVLCIGPSTLTTAEGLGLSVVGVAEPHTAEGLIALAVRTLGA